MKAQTLLKTSFLAGNFIGFCPQEQNNGNAEQRFR